MPLRHIFAVCISVFIFSLPALAALNTPPIATNSTVRVNEDASISIVLQASDVDRDSLTYRVRQPAHGSVTVTNPVTYTPDADFNGEDSFNFRACDASLCSSATITITVNAVNDLPLAMSSVMSTPEDTAVVIELAAANVDAGEALAVTLLRAPMHTASYSLVGTRLTYVPAADFNGEDRFTFFVSDGTFSSAAGEVSVTVEALNDAPVTAEPWVRSANGKPAHFGFLADDVDGDSLSFEMVTPPASGVVVLWNGKYGVYYPQRGFTGTDEFTYRVFDGTEYSDVQTVPVEVLEGPAEFGVDLLEIDTAVAKSAMRNALVLEFPKSPVEGCADTKATPPVFPTTLGTGALLSMHFPSLQCNTGEYADEYAALYVVAPNGSVAGRPNFDAFLLRQGYNDEASPSYLDHGAAVVPLTNLQNGNGGLAVFTDKVVAGERVIEELSVDPFNISVDSSVFEHHGVGVAMSTNVYESCEESGRTDLHCGAIAAVHLATGEVLDLVGGDETHRAWGSGAVVKLNGSLFAGFGSGRDATGDWSSGAHACEVARIRAFERPTPARTEISTDLIIEETVDPGNDGCTHVGTNESAWGTLGSSIINGGLMPVDEDSFIVVALGSDTEDEVTTIHQFDTDFNVEATYTVLSDYSHSLTGGPYNSPVADANGFGYLSAIIEQGPVTQNAVLKFDFINHTVETLYAELMVDTAYSAVHLYLNTANEPVVAFVANGELRVISAEDGSLLETFSLGSSARYHAAPVLIGDGDGVDDSFLTVSQDNVATIHFNTGYQLYEEAVWMGPRAGGFNQGVANLE